MSLKTSIEMLIKAKALIADQKNWSAHGGGVPDQTFCALSALDAARRALMGGAPKLFHDGEAYDLLLASCKDLFGLDYITFLNDGRSFSSQCFPKAIRVDDKSDDERFKLVHQLYDVTIERAEALHKELMSPKKLGETNESQSL